MSDISKDLKKYYRNCQRLKNLQKQTCLALQDISSNLQLGSKQGQIKNELFSDSVAEKLLQSFSRTPAFLVFGQSCHAKALIVNSLLDQAILPLSGTQWRYIRFKHGSSKLIRTTYDNEYEFLDRLHADEKPWVTVPEEDLQRDGGECPLDVKRTVEVEIPHPLLGDNVHILVPPDGECLVEVLRPTSHLQNNVPIVIYAICEELSDRDVEEIRKLKLLVREPFLFISIKDKESMRSTESLTESEQHSVHQGTLERVQNLRDKLVRLGYISDTMVANPDLVPESQDFPLNSFLYINGLTCDIKVDDNFVLFVQEVLKYNELKMANVLSEIHNNCLRKFILSAFDMAREIQITPKRIEYAQTIEMKLYENLMKIAAEQQEQITSIIQRTLQEMKANVEIVFEDEVTQNTKRATLEIQQLVLKRLRNSVASQIVESVDCLQDSFTGTLQRCLESLEKKRQDKKRHDLEGSLSASDSVKQILSAAYSIDLRSSQSSSVVHTFMDRLRTLLANIVSPWSSSSSQNQCDLQWQLQVVTNILDSLSASRLAKTISTQFQEHVRSSHEAFQSAIRSLENQLSGQLEQTEEQRVLIRKRHAPRLARLTLESTSLCDRVVHGMPKQIREIGRGQYGVVFSCEPWGGVNPCAFKSVVPPDDRHWNDLAMEFYYTRTIAEHPRIVKLRGSVIDYAYGYGGGNSASVLLIMERMTRDLHCGLRSGLTWVARLRIAIDVIEGIRYLHSQGLVHRDIKLKNVLLDNDDRAKLTDFGFCIPEAMMSGSVVGTPVHMAPELLSGRYDSSVDVYAFGILFWYICAGQVKLPNHFDHFQNKEQLWSSVRKGIRPECLSQFNRACWNLMEHCWAAEPSERPLLGDVQPQLEAIYQNALSTASSSSPDDAKG